MAARVTVGDREIVAEVTWRVDDVAPFDRNGDGALEAFTARRAAQSLRVEIGGTPVTWDVTPGQVIRLHAAIDRDEPISISVDTGDPRHRTPIEVRGDRVTTVSRTLARGEVLHIQRGHWLVRLLRRLLSPLP